MSSPFESFPDPDFKSAIDEFMDGSVSTYVLGASYGDSAELSQVFPPEPTRFSLVTAAYLSSEDPWTVKNRTTVAIDTLTNKDKKRAVSFYKATVSERHALMRTLLKTTQPTETLRTERGIQQFCIQAVQKSDKRLMAMHVVGQERDSGKQVDALVVPRVISEGIPLLIRDSVVPYLSNSELPESTRENLRKYTDIAPEHRETATIAAASFLPSATIVARTLQRMLGK